MNAEEIYAIFQRSKCQYLSKPYFPHKQFPPKAPDMWSIKKQGAKRLIRKFDTFEDADAFMKENRGKGYHKQYHKGKTLSDEYLESLEILSRRFSTVWGNMEPSIYFDCGFEIFGERFCYLNFFDQRISRLYIIKDKNKKLNINFSKKELVDSAKFVMSYIRENGIPSFGVYCLSRDRYALPVQHYLKNHISPYFLVLLLKERFFRLEDDDRSVVPYILQNYREIFHKLEEVKPFCQKILERFYYEKRV